MSPDYGTYRLTYTPPESDGHEEYPLIAIEMSTGGDANVEQMLRFYEAFLAASGYIIKGELRVVEPESSGFIPFDALDFGDDGYSFVGNPYAPSYAPDTISFGGVNVRSFGDNMTTSF